MIPARVCIWFQSAADEAVRFYAATFPDTRLERIHTAPGDFPDGAQGQLLGVEFTALGLPCYALNGGDAFRQSEAFSFQVYTDTQEETDRYWNAIVDNGGSESACGWCKDKWGVSWQITPRILMESLSSPDEAARARVFEAMMTMRKIDIAAIEAARAG